MEVDRMSRTRVRSQAIALLACSALLFAAFGCSNPGTVMAPDSTPVVVTSPNFVRILPTSKGDPALATAPSASAVVSAQYGGTVSNGRVTLEFPPGALNEDTEITIDMLNDGTLGVELGPHGTQFNKPVVMSTDLHGTTAEGMSDQTSTLWWNELTQSYELQEGLFSGDANNSQSVLHHFSKYVEDLRG
jgi:hypothetical protein